MFVRYYKFNVDIAVMFRFLFPQTDVYMYHDYHLLYVEGAAVVLITW